MRSSTLRRIRLGHVPLMLAAGAGSAGCFADIFGSADPATAEERFEYSIELASEFRLSVIGKAGDITVTSVPGTDSLRVQAVLQVTAEDREDAEAGLSEFWVDIDQSTSRITVITAQPSVSDSRNYVANYEIFVPPFMQVFIGNTVGDITVSGVGNELSIEAGSGNVRLNETFAVTRVQIGNGSIDARVDMPLGTSLGIATGNGDIDVAIPRTTSAVILATTWHGTVSVSNLDVTYDFKTDNAFAGTLGGGLGSISLSSRNGEVTLVGY